MWLLIARTRRPDAPQWPGRRILAVLDAVSWPLCCSVGAELLPPPAGIVPVVVVALSCLWAMRRVHRAVWNNPRYHFTTWRFARLIAVLLALGAILKLWLLLSV